MADLLASAVLSSLGLTEGKVGLRDLEAEAREIACNRIAHLLTEADQLVKADAIRSDVTRTKENTEAELRSEVQKHLEEARVAMEMIQESKKAIEHARTNFKNVDGMARECGALVDHYELIVKVNNIRQNLEETLQAVSQIEGIAKTVEPLHTALEDDKNLLQVFGTLQELQERRSEASKGSYSESELQVLKEKFAPIDLVNADLDRKLWTTIKNVIIIAKEQPETLVRVLLIIQQDKTLQKFEKCKETLRGAIRVHFQEQVDIEMKFRQENSASASAAASASSSSQAPNVSEFRNLLDVSSFAVDDLTDVLDSVVVCFPEEYNIMDIFAKEYHKLTYDLLQPHIDGENLVAIDILAAVEWIAENRFQMERLGIKDLTPSFADWIPQLVTQHRAHIRGLNAEWVSNIVKLDSKSKVSTSSNGLYLTPGPSDLFVMLTQHINVVEPLASVDLAAGVCFEMESALKLYQRHVLEYLKQLTRIQAESDDSHNNQDYDNDPVPRCLAVCNNMVQCYEHSSELIEKCVEVVAEEYKESITTTLETCSEGFHHVAKASVEVAVNFIFSDLEEAMKTFFTKNWKSTKPMEIVLVTLEDYYGDIQPHLEEVFFKKLVLECLDRLVRVILTALLHAKENKFVINFADAEPECIELLKNDVKMMKEFFGAYVRESAIKPFTQLISDLSQVLSSEPAYIMVYFDTMVKNHAGVTVAVAEAILDMRSDMNKSEKETALIECKKIIAKINSKGDFDDSGSGSGNRSGHGGGGGGGGGGGSGSSSSSHHKSKGSDSQNSSSKSMFSRILTSINDALQEASDRLQ